jgi:hypothetical protein
MASNGCFPSKIDDAIPQLKINQIRVLDPLLAYALKKYA